MNPVEQLLEMQELHRLKARYFRFYDTQDWDKWLDLLTEDVTLTADYHVAGAVEDGRIPPMRLEGRSMLLDYIVPLAPLRRTVHHGHMPEIVLHSDASASGIWAMEDIIDYADRRIHGHGHYHESYRRVDGLWKIATIHLTRLRLVTMPV